MRFRSNPASHLFSRSGRRTHCRPIDAVCSRGYRDPGRWCHEPPDGHRTAGRTDDHDLRPRGGVMIGSVEVVAAQAMSSFVAIKLDISIPTQPPRMGVTVIPALGPVPAAPPDQGTVRASRVQAGAGAGINSCREEIQCSLMVLLDENFAALEVYRANRQEVITALIAAGRSFLRKGSLAEGSPPSSGRGEGVAQ